MEVFETARHPQPIRRSLRPYRLEKAFRHAPGIDAAAEGMRAKVGCPKAMKSRSSFIIVFSFVSTGVCGRESGHTGTWERIDV